MMTGQAILRKLLDNRAVFGSIAFHHYNQRRNHSELCVGRFNRIYSIAIAEVLGATPLFNDPRDLVITFHLGCETVTIWPSLLINNYVDGITIYLKIGGSAYVPLPFCVQVHKDECAYSRIMDKAQEKYFSLISPLTPFVKPDGPNINDNMMVDLVKTHNGLCEDLKELRVDAIRRFNESDNTTTSQREFERICRMFDLYRTTCIHLADAIDVAKGWTNHD